MKTNTYTFIRMIFILLPLIWLQQSLSAAEKKVVWPFMLNCPANAYVDCTDELWNLSMYGNATYSYGPYTYSAGNAVVHYYLNSCNVGYITRTWTVEDNNWQWHSCTQTIYVSSGGPDGPVINWPQDLELEGCDPNTNPNQLQPPYNYPTWNADICSMLGRSYSDMVFTVNSQCKKIMRTWKILDWCNYSPTNGYGIYTKVQWIYIISKTPPEVTCPAEITVNSFNCKNAQVVVNPLVIDPSVCGGDFTVTNNSPYATAKGNNISGLYPIGTTKVTWSIKYGCNKQKVCTTNVVVLNASKPTPYCIGSIITALMPVDTDHDGKVDNGMVELWAKDLDKGSKSACGYAPLKFSFSKDVTKTSKTFTCDDIGKNLVEMWVTDSKGAQNYCLVEVIIQNNGANIPDCHPKPVVPVDTIYQIKGNVLSLTDSPVKGAKITMAYKTPIVTYNITYDTTTTLQLDSFINLSGYKLYRYIQVRKITEHRDSTLTYTTKMAFTGADGKYLLDSIKQHQKAVLVSGEYTDEAKKYIDNNDVELLTKFLLGEINFGSYHQFLASDINEDGKITVEDQNILMSFVTGQIAVLPGSHQWYLLDKKATFVKPEDILTSVLPLTVCLDSVSKIAPVVDFVAIKKGNLSVDPGSINTPETEKRNSNSAKVTVQVYPNPFSDRINFNLFSDVSTTGKLQLFNSSGQEIMTLKRLIQKGENEINVEWNADITGLILYKWTIEDKQVTGTLSRIQ